MMTEKAATIDERQIMPSRKLIVFDMDNTLLIGRFVDICAERFGFTRELALLRATESGPGVLTKKIARFFKEKSHNELVGVANSIPLVEGTVKVISGLQQKGYIVGIVSDSYQFVVDAIQKKIGADFSIGNVLEFLEGKATGNVTIPSSFYYHINSNCNHALCKTNVLMHLVSKYNIPLSNCIAIGDSENDLCMIEHAGMGIAFCATYDGLKPVANKIIDTRSFEELLSL